VVAGHRCHGRPSEIVVQHLSQFIVRGEPDIGQSLVEAGNRTAIHFIVLPVSAVHLDHGGFVTIIIGIGRRATECLGPISGESLDMPGMQAMAKRMGHNVVGHHPIMPGGSKAAQAFAVTRCLEDSLNVPDDDNPFVPMQDTAAADSPQPRDPVRSSIVAPGLSLRDGRFLFPIG